MATIAIVPSNLIPVIWDQCSPHIDLVVERTPDELSTETILAKLMRHDAEIIAVIEEDKIIACVIFEITTCDTGHRFLYVSQICGAKMNEWFSDCLELLKIVARGFDIHEIRGASIRKGWDRILDQNDWKDCYTVKKYTF